MPPLTPKQYFFGASTGHLAAFYYMPCSLLFSHALPKLFHYSPRQRGMGKW